MWGAVAVAVVTATAAAAAATASVDTAATVTAAATATATATASAATATVKRGVKGHFWQFSLNIFHNNFFINQLCHWIVAINFFFFF